MSFDDHIRNALDRVLTGVRGDLEADLRAFAQDLLRAAADERGRAVKEAGETAAAAVRRQAHAQLTQLRDATQKHTEELRRSAEERIDAARRDALAEAVDVRRSSETKVAEIKAATDRRIADMAREVERTRATARAEAEELVVAQLAVAATENVRATAEAVERARTDENQAALAQAARFADAIQALDEAHGLGDVLETLAERAGQEVDRAAVLLVKDDRLTGWSVSGFDPSVPHARSIDLSLDEAGLPGAVVRTGVAVSRPAVDPERTDERQPALPPFARDAGMRHALALPVTVGGAVVGVLYADAPRLETPSATSRWPAVLDVLARHASRVLEAMTVQQALGLSLPRIAARGVRHSLPGPIEHTGQGADEDAARRCARLLVSEIRLFNEPLVDAGRESRDLLSRLSGEIERARRIYEARIPADVPARADYFDQELVRTLADGDRSLLGGAP